MRPRKKGCSRTVYLLFLLLLQPLPLSSPPAFFLLFILKTGRERERRRQKKDSF